MEQPNMMGNGMAPNMNMNRMQQPQPGNAHQQLHAKIMDNLRRKMAQLPAGWQSTFDIGQRANKIMQLFSQLALLNQDRSRCLTIAESFEERTILDSPSREVYMETIDQKLSNILQRRSINAQQMQPGQMGMNNGNNMDMSQSGMPNMNMMPNGGMGGMMGMNMNMNMNMGMNMANNGMGGLQPGQMGVNGGQQNPNFPTHLQRQMQPSPLSQQPQQVQQQQNTGVDPPALQNPQMQAQMPNMNQPNPQQQAKANQGGAPQQTGAPMNAQIQANAQRLYHSIPEDKRPAIRDQFLSQLTEAQRQHLKSQGGDPLMKLMIKRSQDAWVKQRPAAQTNPAGQQNNGDMPMGNNMGMSGNNVQQTPASQAGGTSIDFTSIMGQQANAIKSQESGGEVVPASNNVNFNMGGQANMPQGVNPQMLNQNNQGGQGGTGNTQANNVRLMAMQQEKQRQERMQKQNQFAQQQALAQQQAQNQLRGQPGGLNTPNALNGGQVNSPSMNMNMLNRPMAPPGQTTPSTPQQNRPQQGVPQTPVNPANQLAQHHQSMLNQNNQAINLGMQNPMQFLASLPQAQQEHIRQLPAPHAQDLLRRMAASKASTMHANQQAMPPNTNGGGPQLGNQQSMANGLAPNMGNAIPGFNAQPPPNQQPQQQGQSSMAMQQRMQQFQQSQFRQSAMDAREFPKQVLGTLGMQVPPNVVNWRQLKDYITTNQAVLPPNSLEKLRAAQNQWFDAHPEEMQAAITVIQHRLRQHQAAQAQQQQQQPQMQPNQPPTSMAMPNGQAPQAQMVPPMQQPGNQNAGGPNINQGQMRGPQVPPTSDAEVKELRERLPNFANMNDDQVKTVIMRKKQQAALSNMQTQQQLRNAQMRSAQALANGGQQGGEAMQGGPPQHQQQSQGQRPPQAQQGQNQQPNNQGQGQKRPQTSNDDVIEIPNPTAPATGMPQPPAMQQAPSQQGRLPQRMPTQEELNRMPPQQRNAVEMQIRQYQALQKAQMGIGNTQSGAPVRPPQQSQQQPPSSQQPQPQTQPQATPQQQPNGQQQQGAPTAAQKQFQQDTQRLKNLWQEAAQAHPKGPPLNQSPADVAQCQALFKRMWSPVVNMDKTWMSALRAGFGEARLRQVMRVKLAVQQNCKDENGTIRDYLALAPNEFKKMEQYINLYFKELKHLKDLSDAAKARGQGSAANGTQAQQAQPPQPPQPQQPEPKPPLNRKQSQQSHGRKASTQKAPPAPTENKTFDWGAPSPHGVPKYDPGRNELTPDKLKMPQKKRQKTGHQADSQVSTPVTQTGTPAATATSPGGAVAKLSSPEQAMKRVIQAKPVEQPKPKFKCDDQQCKFWVNGFETDEQLKEHKEKAHQPIEDPLKFLLDNTVEVPKGVIESKSVPATKAVKAAQPRGKPVGAAKASLKKEVQTPQIKQESMTPGSAEKGKSTAPAMKKTDSKTPDEVHETEKTLLEAMANKIGFELPPADTPILDTLAVPKPESATADAAATEEAWTDILATAFTHTDGFFNDWVDLPTGPNVDWGLPPSSFEGEASTSPELTPSNNSEASQSSRESDISTFDRLRINFEWDAFGDGNTGVPKFLNDLKGLGLEGEQQQQGKDDGAGGGKAVDCGMDWSSDLFDWEMIVGSSGTQGGIFE